MLLCIQFPLSDLRGFIADTGRLSAPQWQLPEPGTDFVRYFGKLERRKDGPLQGWVSENVIADARRAVRFPAQALSLHGDPPRHDFTCAFRRFLFDALATGKYEVGLCNWAHTQSAPDTWQLEPLVHALLRLPVQVPNPPGKAVSCELGSAGQPLAALYRTASTISPKKQPVQPAGWWVRAGQPIVLVEYRSDEEHLELPAYASPIDLGDAAGAAAGAAASAAAAGSLTLSHFYITYKGNDIRVWALGYASKAARQTVRRLRVYLTRLHAEHQCLRIALRSLMRKQLSIEPRGDFSRKFQDYVNDATSHISQLAAKPQGLFGSDVPEIAEVVRASANPIDSAERESLLAAIDALDPELNIRRKMQGYTNQWWDRAAFALAMQQAFTLDEIKGICFDMSIDFDRFPPNGEPAVVRELILYCERNDRLPELIQRCKALRPDEKWD
jgi:hypothetical protein